MSQTKSLPLITSAQLKSHNSATDCWVSLHNRKVYNVTDFLDQHPGGDDLITDFAGQDITNIMNDVVSHIHSESAYEILDDEYLVAFLATPEEEAKLLASGKNGDALFTAINGKADAKEGEEYDPTTLDHLPTYDKLSIQTDYSKDYTSHKFLDLNKPLLPQMIFGNFDKRFYLDQIHRPRHYGKGSAPIFGNFLEPLSLTAWWVVPLVWLPINFYIFSTGFKNLPVYVSLIFWSAGLFVWTLIEYIMHRFLFHLDYYLPEHQLAYTMHFLFHGVHHYLPMDKYRLVMPPTLFCLLCFPFYKLVFFIFPYNIACVAFAGGHLGYILYDLTHYFLHHAKLPQFYQELKKYHLEHHYKNYELGFGVTSKFWDTIFGTELVDTKLD